ncbi:MAG: hypothetical protein GC152_11060 [Alphaproteobacteria bacterium]|nr:hypothetical protein [Alphaproteobacteria bacterium]
MSSEFDVYFAKQTGAVGEIADALRQILDDAAPEAARKLAWGFPCWIGETRIASIIAHASRCNLQFWSGDRLAKGWPDRIEGTGKNIRHVKVSQVSEIDDELRAIVRQAVELDRNAPIQVP